MEKDCLFCKIISKTIPAEIVFEDKELIAIKDVHPQAPVHLLVIPKTHKSSALDLGDSDQNIMGAIILKIKSLAQEKGIDSSGFRMVLNCGEDGGQTVSHIHFHLLGGRSMGWPPG